MVVAQIFVTAKHPAIRYFLPSLMITGLLNAVIMAMLLNGETKPLIKRFGWMATILVIFIGWGHSFAGITKKEASNLIYQVEQQIMLKKVADLRDSGCQVFESYRVPTIVNALNFSDRITKRKFSDYIWELYPHRGQYNIWSGKFVMHGKTIPPFSVMRIVQSGKGCVYIYGFPMYGVKEFTHQLLIEPVFKIGKQEINKVIGFKREEP